MATLVLGAATLVVALVAALQDRIRGWLWRPELTLRVVGEPPDSHKTLMDFWSQAGLVARVDCYYLRLLVSNEGPARATDAQLYVDRLEKRNADGSYALVTRFLPMNLKWSNAGGSPYIAIPPGAKRHCDLGHILDPAKRGLIGSENDPSSPSPPNETVLSFDVEAQSNTFGYLAGPGAYRLALLLASAETRVPRRYVLEINHTGNWFDDENQMLRDGIGISLLE